MVKDEIKYISEDMRIDELKDKEQQTRIYKLLDMPLKDLIERYSKSQTYGEYGKVVNDDYYDIPIALQEILHIAPIKEINDSIESIKIAIENLDAKLRNHRHDTTKQFSAKPEF
jgi:uncharacterized Ntn-hydrolase superfamily protein